MKKQQDLAEKFAAGRKADDELKDVARRFIELAFEATDPKRGLEGTAAIAADADEEMQRMEARPTSEREHIADLNREGALRKFATEVSRERGFNEDEAESMSGDQLLDALVQAVRDRQAGR